MIFRCFRTIKKDGILEFFLLMLAYVAEMVFIYVYCITPRYGYLGTYLDFNLTKFLVGIVIVFVLLLTLYCLWREGTDSGIIIVIISIMYFLPTIILCGLRNLEWSYFLFSVLFIFFLLCLHAIRLKYRIGFGVSVPVYKDRIVDAILLLFSAIIIWTSGRYAGFRVSFDFSEYVDLRLESRGYEWPTIIGYVVSNAYFVLPVGILLFYLLKKRLMLILTIIAQIFLFSLTGKKSAALVLILVIGIMLFYRKKRIILYGINILNIIGILDYYSPISFNLVNIVQRRLMYVPALLGSQYFEFIGMGYEKLYLRQSIVSKLGITYLYDGLRIQQKISEVFYGSPINNANTGLLGDAFVNFGWWSLLIYPIMLTSLLFIVDIVMEGVNEKLRAVIWVNIAYTLIGQSFFTCLLSGGILVIIFMFSLYAKRNSLKAFGEEN